MPEAHPPTDASGMARSAAGHAHATPRPTAGPEGTAPPVPIALPAAGDRLSHGLFSNLLAKLVILVLGVAAVPFYLRYLSVDAYGLIGLFMVLLSLSTLLDAGFGTATNRFVALHANVPDGRARTRHLVRTLEGLYWLVALLIVALGVPLAGLASEHLLHSGTLAEGTVRAALALMVTAVALQFPFALYGGGLLGLQRHFAHNAILAGAAILRVGGGISVLAFWSASVEAFFAWQVAVGLAQSLVGAALLWRHLPGPRASFRLETLRPTLRFAAGAGAAMALGALLAHADKLTVSTLTGLEDFGYYNLGVVIASSVYMLAIPALTVFFPRLTRLVALGDEAELARTYHLGNQIVAVAVVPAAAVAATFAREVLFVWTGSPELAAEAHPAARALVLAAAVVALNGIPHALQMAHGWTGLALRLAVGGLVVALPAYVLAIEWTGRVGAAVAWLGVCVATTAVSVAATHRRFLPGHAGRWLRRDVAPALLASVAVATAAALARPEGLGRVATLAYLVVVSLSTLAAATLATPRTRTISLAMLKSARTRTGSR